MTRMLGRARWAPPLVLLLLLAAGIARPAAAAPVPACLSVTAAATAEDRCYREMVMYVTAAGRFVAAVEAYNRAADQGTGAQVETAGQNLEDAGNDMAAAGILLVVCLLQMM